MKNVCDNMLIILLNIGIAAILCVLPGCKQSDKINPMEIIRLSPESPIQEANLSTYASSVEYIPLETHDSCLIGEGNRIVDRQIDVSEDHILFSDGISVLLFDRKGAFVCKIGRKGNGPGEYRVPNPVKFVSDGATIEIGDNGQSYFYDLNGHFLYSRRYQEMIKDSIQLERIYSLGDGLLACSGIIAEEFRGALLIADTLGNVIHKIIMQDTIAEHTQALYKGVVPTVYLKDDLIRFYNVIEDTLFTVNKVGEREPSYAFDFGKYKQVLVWKELIQRSREYAHLIRIIESDNYLFLDLDFGKHGKEVLTYYITDMFGNQVARETGLLGAIYDKVNKNVVLLKQSQPNIIGMRDDLLGGVPFWPKKIANDGSLVSFIEGSTFKELSDAFDTSSKVYQMGKSMSPEDNPIVMVAKPKR